MSYEHAAILIYWLASTWASYMLTPSRSNGLHALYDFFACALMGWIEIPARILAKFGQFKR